MTAWKKHSPAEASSNTGEALRISMAARMMQSTLTPQYLESGTDDAYVLSGITDNTDRRHCLSRHATGALYYAAYGSSVICAAYGSSVLLHASLPARGKMYFATEKCMGLRGSVRPLLD